MDGDNNASKSSCCNGGNPGYASPIDAMKNGPREKLLYTVCVQSKVHKQGRYDYLATIDADPHSPSYSKIIHRLQCPYPNDELVSLTFGMKKQLLQPFPEKKPSFVSNARTQHHMGWNVCSSCHGNNPTGAQRRFLIMPGFESTNIYIVDVGTDPRQPRMHKVILGTDVAEKCDLTKPHTIHCLPSGEIMLSCLGDKHGDAKGGFLLIDAQTFEIKGEWEKPNKPADFGYDFWYQPRHNVMISTEWGSPNYYINGFRPVDVADKLLRPKVYGDKLNIWDWQKREIIQKIDLGMEGKMTFEVRFAHNPDRADGYVGAIFAGAVFYFYKSGDKFETKKVIQLPIKDVEGWHLEDAIGKKMPGLAADLLLSLDDRWMYLSNFAHGEVRQYDISNPQEPRLTAVVYAGSAIAKYSGIKVTSSAADGPYNTPHDITTEQPDAVVVRGKRVDGAPNMLQLSLDGTRLYVTTSLYTPWDAQFYPKMAERTGGTMLLIDCDITNGGMKLNQDFMVDFGAEPDGPVGAHEVRYPGGDCTSDIWI